MISPILLRSNFTYEGWIAKNFILLTEEEKLSVWRMRNHENVRIQMKNQKEISLTNHLIFIDELTNKDHDFYWLVMDNNLVHYGVIYINKVDFVNKCCEFGIYKNPFLEKKRTGMILSNIELYIVFEIADFSSVILDVKETNQFALNLYEKLNFERIVSEEKNYVKMILYKSSWSEYKK